jgi:GTP-binding protein EngB required for normal cell division
LAPANDSCLDRRASFLISIHNVSALQADIFMNEAGRDSRQQILMLISELMQRYQITSIQSFVENCRLSLERSDLNLGILGRFKAGKSSFLNHLIGRELLPVGVIPVTTVVTDLAGSETDFAEVQLTNGSRLHVGVNEISQFISEIENPDNARGVASVSVRIPELRHFEGIHFFDTPGLESAFAHNTDAALSWAPNVDVALIAVAVDPPLSQQDLALMRKLMGYTPRIVVLLTKVDLLSQPEQDQVLHFVKTQLARYLGKGIDVWPYSTRPGYENHHSVFVTEFIDPLRRRTTTEHAAIVDRKLQTLVRECRDYLQLTLKSAEMTESEKSQLHDRVINERSALADTRLELKLIAKHAIAGCRKNIETVLSTDERVLEEEIQQTLALAVPLFPKGFAELVEAFEDWLRTTLLSRLATLSRAKSEEVLQPLRDVQRQYTRLLQNFRDRLSEQVINLYGVPLRTNESEIGVKPPAAPDVKVGRMFDHNWELLSPLIPMTIFRNVVIRRFQRKVDDEVFKNLSRLTTQWEAILSQEITQVQRDAEGRIEDLISTVDRLTSAPASEVDDLRTDLNRLDTVARKINDDENESTSRNG